MYDEDQTNEPPVTDADEFDADEFLEFTSQEAELCGEHFAEPAPEVEFSETEPTPLGAQAAGSRPLFQLPFRCGQQWNAFTRATHSPNPNSLDMTKVGGGSNGQPILASAAGRVAMVPRSPHKTAGWYVRIDHGNGWQTRYLHMIERPPVTIGQRVSRGQIIGRVGSTGRSSGPHLHYEQMQNGTTVRAAFNGVLVTVAVGRAQRLTSKNCNGPEPQDDLDPKAVPDGILVREPDGTIAVAAGRAPFRFASWDECLAAGYRDGQWINVSAGFLGQMPATPREGTLLRDNGTGAISVIAGGAKFWLSSWEELVAAGYQQTPFVNVPARYIDALPTMPSDGTLLRAPGDSTVWKVVAGHRSVTTPAPGDVVTVIPLRNLEAIPL